MTTPPNAMATVLRWAGNAIGLLLVTLLLLALVEGVSSLLLFAIRIQPQSFRAYTRYDKKLGWVSRPRQHVRDLYGPGEHVTTNTQGFRGAADVSPDVPAGHRRVICSGDSFTFGHGVGDQSTWCTKLTTPTIETVNIGQDGYGLDQVYLRYRRDGLPLAHHVHIVAFILDDFGRMAHTTFLGYGKPRLRLKDGQVIVTKTCRFPEGLFASGG